MKKKDGTPLIKWLPRHAKIIFFGERNKEFFAITQVGYRSNTQRIFRGETGKMKEVIIKSFIENVGGSYDIVECKENIDFDLPKRNAEKIIMRDFNNGGRFIIQKTNYQLAGNQNKRTVDSRFFFYIAKGTQNFIVLISTKQPDVNLAFKAQSTNTCYLPSPTSINFSGKSGRPQNSKR